MDKRKFYVSILGVDCQVLVNLATLLVPISVYHSIWAQHTT
jgi:hypothetical protein